MEGRGSWGCLRDIGRFESNDIVGGGFDVFDCDVEAYGFAIVLQDPMCLFVPSLDLVLVVYLFQ